jgi:hypothetical protein
MNVRKLKENEIKIEEQIVMSRKRIRRGGNLREGDGEENDKGMEGKRRRR